MIKNMILTITLLALPLLHGEVPAHLQQKQSSFLHEEMPTPTSISQTPTTLVAHLKAFKQQCDESGATAITHSIITGIAIQCALVFGWNNQLTQEAVTAIKKSLTDFCIKHGIYNINFINSIIAGINQTFSLETIPTTGKTYFYTSIFTHLMELASDPIASSIWYVIFYKAITVGPTALLAPQTLLTTIASGTLSGLLSQYMSTAASTALGTLRELATKIILHR